MKGYMLIVIGLLAGLPQAASAAEFTTLEERMTGDEFSRSGLDRLTPEQLRYLNDWLQNEGQAPVPAAATGGATSDASVSERQMGLRARGQPDNRVVIESSIVGDFTGWSGRTRFKLANGQVWEQVGGGSYYARRTDPAVRIEPKTLGSWKMYIDGLGRSVKVKRIK